MDIRIIQWQQALPLRHQVLWPNKPPHFCKVEGDAEATHYGAYINEKLVSVASVYIEKSYQGNANNSARLRKFATLPAYQRRGIGSELITYILQHLKNAGIDIFWCDARKSAVGFYHRFNMVEQGGEFDKSGVMYFKMQVKFSQ